MHPVQPSRHAQPGLVEPGHSGRAAISSPTFRRRHALRGGAAAGGPARTAARDQLVLGHLHRHRRQVEHLAAFHTHLRGTRQVRSAPGARGQARAASARLGPRPAPTSSPDARADRRGYSHSCGATTSAPAWRTVNPTTAASTSSSSPCPAGASARRSPPPARRPAPEAHRSPAPARRPGRQARHTTDAHPRPAPHDHLMWLVIPSQDLTSYVTVAACRSVSRSLMAAESTSISRFHTASELATSPQQCRIFTTSSLMSIHSCSIVDCSGLTICYGPRIYRERFQIC